jgi:hypothetical protein
MTAARAATGNTKTRRAAAERRAARRYPCLSECLVRVEDMGEPLDWPGMIYNISSTGLGLALPFPALVGTVVQVELRGRCKEPMRLRAQVVRCGLEKYVWFHGCELVAALGVEELQRWLAELVRRQAR